MTKNRKYLKALFLCGFIIILLFFYAIFVRGQKIALKVENRSAEKIPKLNVADFLNGDFQMKLENSIKDQFIFGETIKTKIKEVNSKYFYLSQRHANCSGYKYIANGYYVYKCSDYLLNKRLKLSDLEQYMEKVADSYSGLSTMADKYLYYVTIDADFNFDYLSNEFFEYVKDKYKEYNIGLFKLNGYSDYENYFYKTDHHWNHKGSYRGYSDIIKLILGDDEKLLIQVKEIEFNVDYFGSKARRANFLFFKEKFKVYDFNLPKYTITIDGEVSQYGKRDKYYANEFSTDTYVNHYASFYGGDRGEIIYDTSRTNKKNLLMIASSYSNAINELIASHFNKTYIIDLRHYENFNYEDYIRENNIDIFLLLGDVYTLANKDFMLGEE